LWLRASCSPHVEAEVAVRAVAALAAVVAVVAVASQ
jgi:hypothetical protein